MEDVFKIFVEQLRDGHIEKISEDFSPESLELKDKEFEFKKPISVSGDAYLANDSLVLNLTINAEVEIPCTICNQPVEEAIALNHFYHVEPLDEIKSGVYNFREVLREDILLNTPQFAECGGNCPRREEVKKYLKPAVKSAKEQEEQEGYQPFADLSLDAIQQPKKKKLS